jgi:hypothetical protein
LRFNIKLATLLLGLLVGAVAGYVTRPESAELRIGQVSVEISGNQISAGSGGGLTNGQMQHVMLFTLIGGLAGLLVGFAAGRSR